MKIRLLTVYVLYEFNHKPFMKYILQNDSTNQIGQKELMIITVGGQIRYYQKDINLKYFCLECKGDTIALSDTLKSGYIERADLTDYYTIDKDGTLNFSDSESVNYAKGIAF